MKVVCNTAELLAAVQLVAGAVPTRTTMPVYQNIKIVAEDDKMVLMGTDLDVGIRYAMNGDTQVKEAGDVVVSPDKLAAILRETNDAYVDLECDGKNVTVKTTSSEYEMPTEDPDTFNDVEVFDGDKYAELTAGDLNKLIRRTVFAAAKDEGKYAMQGVLLDRSGSHFLMVATDGKRLAVATGPELPKVETNASALVPVKALQLLDKVLSGIVDDAVVKVAFDTSKACFATEQATISTRLVEGRFPSWRDVIPKKYAVSIDLDSKSFTSAVRQAAIMTDMESKRVEFAFADGTVKLSAKGATTGKSKVSLKLPYEYEAMTIGLDPDFIKDAMKVMGDTVKLSLVAADKSVVFMDGKDYLHLVVPMI